MREAPARAPLSPAGRQSIAERLLSGTRAAIDNNTQRDRNIVRAFNSYKQSSHQLQIGA